jgi:UDP-N-acetylmuramate dehydrogenase
MMLAEKTRVPMEGLRGRLRFDEPMSRHTSWRAGGPAERWFEPADAGDLTAYLQRLPADEGVLWVGLGSNLLVRDGGVRGSVILTTGALADIARLDEVTVRFEAGVPCAKAARYCARAGLAGAGFLAGIPGTMGGALAMNAGAFGGETWDLVHEVETLDRRGRVRVRRRADFVVGYRSVRGPSDEWFIAARLRLQPGDTNAEVARIKELLARRSETQPTGVASCGSVFRNPAGDYAGRLIDSCGLKGHCIGRACVSDKHANFIVNRGGATASDIEALIHYVQDVVERECGVRLEPEVHIVGDPATPAGGAHA